VSRWATGIALGAALGSTACFLPRVLTTQVEVITAADSKPAFGPKAELRAMDETLSLVWDPKLGMYRGSEEIPHALRVARLKGDVFLFQADLGAEDEGYALVPVRISSDGVVMPLSCDVPQAAAASYGVLTSTSHEYGLALRGDRAGILGLLVSVLPTCRPLTRIEHWMPPTVELAAQAAQAGTGVTPGCQSCPAGACVQGTVTDQSGASLPGAIVSVKPASGAGSPRTARSDDAGRFLVTGLAAGDLVVAAEAIGFAPVVTPPFAVAPSTTYLFESPLELRASLGRESSRQPPPPIACRNRRPSSKR
jgi:Carboxypeptidase regulatory-like domain